MCLSLNSGNRTASHPPFLQNEFLCSKYIANKISSHKLASLLQIPTVAQRFETPAVDLFGPLPQTAYSDKCIVVVEKQATKWVELFSLSQLFRKLVLILVEEVFLNYGTCGKLSSDNGVQFVSEVMQIVTFCLALMCFLSHSIVTLLKERNNRDRKTTLFWLKPSPHIGWLST